MLLDQLLAGVGREGVDAERLHAERAADEPVADAGGLDGGDVLDPGNAWRLRHDRHHAMGDGADHRAAGHARARRRRDARRGVDARAAERLEAACGLDFRRCEYLVGTSAGSIVAATLVAGRRLEAGDRAARAWARGRRSSAPRRRCAALGGGVARLTAAAASPLAPVALATLAPAGRLARAAALAAAPRPTAGSTALGRQLDALGARFDGRLRITAVDRRSGRRVVFGAPGAPERERADAVLASCAVPWLFAPVDDRRPRVRRRRRLEPDQPRRRARRPRRAGPVPRPDRRRRPAAGGHERRADAEELALRARGMRVRTLVPDAASAAAMGTEPDGREPRRARARRGVRPGPRARLRRRRELALAPRRASAASRHLALGVGQRAHVGERRPPR